MANETEGQTLRDYGKRKKRYRRVRRFIFGMVVLGIAAAGIIYWIRLTNMTYHNYEVVNTTQNTGEYKGGYLSYGSSVVKYNKDGAIALNKEGDVLWNASFEMADPIAESCEEYVVIADRGNKVIHTFNKDGEVGNITTLHNIVKVEIAKQGVVAALMEEEDTNYIKFFKVDGSEVTSSEDTSTLAEMVKGTDEVGYPLDFSLSNDGKKMVVSFLSVTSGKLVSAVGFYNFDEVGQNKTDNFTGGQSYEDIIVPKVEFLNNDTVCIYRENGIDWYSVREIPNQIKEVNFDQKIKSILSNDKYSGVVIEEDGDTTGKLMLYDLKGNKVLDKKLSMDYDKIYLAGEEIIIHDNLTCLVMKTSGKEKFRYTFDGNISAFYPINGMDKYYLINGSEISTIILKE
ncbi:MAG: hypothetical protein K0S76_2672 [Herbinix sp.]|jgi:hypothetical protein|nr:hypothetical protein [Herbinix sp.]